MIYFIQRGEGGPIKIGYTGSDPRLRRSTLQYMAPEPLAILAVVEGDEGHEAAIHALLAQHRIRGEWFEPHEMVFALMQQEKIEPIKPELSRTGRIRKMVAIDEDILELVRPVALDEGRRLGAQISWLVQEALAAREKRGG